MQRISGSEIDKILIDDGFTETERDLITNGFFTAYQNKGTEENFKDYMKGYYLTRGSGATKEAETVKEQVEAKEVDKNYIEYPLPAHNKVLRDGKFKINTFTSIMTDSNKNIEGVDNMGFTNYLYENKLDKVIDHINELEVEAGRKPTSKRTINNHIKSIIGTGYGLIELQNTPNGLVYKLKAEMEGGYYVKVPYCQIRELLIGSNKNMLRLYIFLKDYLKNAKQGEFTTIDRSFIARSIGLSGNAGRLTVISTMVNMLARLGYIEIKKVNESYVDKDGNKAYRTINSYRIRTLEEWEAIKKQAGGESQ